LDEDGFTHMAEFPCAAMEKQERWSTFRSADDDERLSFPCRYADLVVRHRPMFEKCEITFSDQALSFGGFVNAIHAAASFARRTSPVVCDRFHLFDENYLGRGITLREREVNRVIADVPRPTRDEFTKASPVVGKQGASCFLKPRQVARDGGHEAIGRVLRCADAIPIATSAPRLVN